MTLAKASPPKCIGARRSTRQHPGRRWRAGARHRKLPERARSASSRSDRNRFRRWASLSVAALLLAWGNTTPAPALANAFVPSQNCCRTALRHARTPEHRVRQLPKLSHRARVPLCAKREDRPGESSDEESLSFGSFFSRRDRGEGGTDGDETKGDDEESRGFLGRFFASDEEKEERKRTEKEEKRKRKREEKKEKERAKREAKERKKRQRQSDDGDDDEDGFKKRNILPNVKGYLEERQMRKDREILRFQVKRMEEERQKQFEKDAEELRLTVQKREAERQKQMAELQKRVPKFKMPTAPVVTNTSSRTKSSKEDIVRRKIQKQKEIDRIRKERLEKIREDQQPIAKPKPSKEKAKRGKDSESRINGETKSKSQRFGDAVSAAQKFVSGVFESKEEWVVVAPKTRISPGEIVPVEAGGIDLLLVAAKDGSAVHCVANSCPHLGTPLEIGSLERLPIESGPSVDPNNAGVQPVEKKSFFQDNEIARMLRQDGCEDCIVCPLHKTAFALESGEVRGEWCPYPPVIGKITGAYKKEAKLPIFDVRTRGKNIEVRLNSPVEIEDESSPKKKR